MLTGGHGTAHVSTQCRPLINKPSYAGATPRKKGTSEGTLDKSLGGVFRGRPSVELVVRAAEYGQVSSESGAIMPRQKGEDAVLSHCNHSVAICSPAKSFTFSGLMEHPLVGKKLKS